MYDTIVFFSEKYYSTHWCKHNYLVMEVEEL